MNLKKFLHDDDAVSPVIGVILMVAITVILAAVIASFVLGLGDTAGSAAPQASWSYSYDDSGSISGGPLGDDAKLTVTHDGGDTINLNQVTIRDDDGKTADPTTSGDMISEFSDSDAEAGDSGSVGIDSDDTVRLVWEDPDGGSTSVLSTYEA